MSVPSQTPYNIYTANGLTTVFAYQFMIMTAGDLEVSVNGTPIASGFTVQGSGQTGGGQVVFLTPPDNGAIVTLLRKLSIKRDTDYQDNGDLLAETINADFDRLWLAMQQEFLSDSLSLKRPLLGGPYNAGGLKIINLQDPTNPHDAVTKAWVDLQYSIPTSEAKQAAVEAKAARDVTVEIADKFGDVDGAISAAEEARDTAISAASNADADAERAEAAADTAVAISDTNKTYQDIPTGLANTVSGEYFRVPQGVGNTLSFIYYLNNNGAAVAVADQVGSGPVRAITPFTDKMAFSTSLSLNDEFDIVYKDEQNNIFLTIKDANFDFHSLSSQGLPIDAEGILDTSVAKYSTGSGSLNPVAYIILDEDKNIIFDALHYNEQSKKWDLAYDFSQLPTPVNPYAPFTQLDAAGKSQIRVYDTENNIEIAITSGSSNETNPRPDVLDRIVWTSDRADNSPGGLFYARGPDFVPYPYIARAKLVGWGDSFMENVRFMNRLAELTGLYCYNFGKSSQQSVGVAAKQGGAKTSYTPVGGSIPASGGVTLSPSVPGPLAAFGNAAMSSIAVNYAGIPGMFGWDGSAATFTRTSAGSAVSISSATPIDVIPTTTQAVTNGASAGTVYYQNDECINIIWMGRNNISQTDTIIANYHSTINYLKSIGIRPVVPSTFPGSGENTGTNNNTYVHLLNSKLKDEFPEYFVEIDGVDLLQNFMNHHNPASPGDLEDIANGVTPRSLRYDWLHPSQSLSNSLTPEYALYVGAEVNAEFVYQFMKRKGWVL
ncbi:hypothetical protein AB8R75_06650 [Klebsiella quasipneumoniae subsp. similipneumoniae]|uniref:hypothetical protein n=1 Tax=Klebsiella quasipneumoniae TaxID=1463165 RepID=UPI0038D21765